MSAVNDSVASAYLAARAARIARNREALNSLEIKDPTKIAVKKKTTKKRKEQQQVTNDISNQPPKRQTRSRSKSKEMAVVPNSRQSQRKQPTRGSVSSAEAAAAIASTAALSKSSSSAPTAVGKSNKLKAFPEKLNAGQLLERGSGAGGWKNTAVQMLCDRSQVTFNRYAGIIPFHNNVVALFINLELHQGGIINGNASEAASWLRTQLAKSGQQYFNRFFQVTDTNNKNNNNNNNNNKNKNNKNNNKNNKNNNNNNDNDNNTDKKKNTNLNENELFFTWCSSPSQSLSSPAIQKLRNPAQTIVLLIRQSPEQKTKEARANNISPSTIRQSYIYCGKCKLEATVDGRKPLGFVFRLNETQLLLQSQSFNQLLQ